MSLWMRGNNWHPMCVEVATPWAVSLHLSSSLRRDTVYSRLVDSCTSMNSPVFISHVSLGVLVIHRHVLLCLALGVYRSFELRSYSYVASSFISWAISLALSNHFEEPQNNIRLIKKVEKRLWTLCFFRFPLFHILTIFHWPLHYTLLATVQCPSFTEEKRTLKHAHCTLQSWLFSKVHGSHSPGNTEYCKHSCQSSALFFLGRDWFTQRILETRTGQMKIVCCGLKTVPTEECAGMHAQFVRLVSIEQISVTTTDFSLNRTLSRWGNQSSERLFQSLLIIPAPSC